MADLILSILIILAFVALVYLLAKNQKPCDTCGGSGCGVCFQNKRDEEKKMLDSDEMFP